MYISNLKLWNFRKYGNSNTLSELNLDEPHLSVPFQLGLNVLIGENDSGKTAIIDAIKLVLKTHAYENIRLDEQDFFSNSKRLRIEIIFDDLTDHEARHFLEWLGIENNKLILRIIYDVSRNNGRIIPSDICAGMDDFGSRLHAEAREFLKVTYLKPLRNAEGELAARRYSRLSQILREHEQFKYSEKEHELERIIKDSNEEIKQWFSNSEREDQIKGIIDEFLAAFVNEDAKIEINLANPDIITILEKLSIGIIEGHNLGLGTMNRLYMAVELLHLRRQWDGLNLCLIEELEAHLHPQAQMKVIEKLQDEGKIQYIIASHSPNLVSKVKLNSLIICKENGAFSLGEDFTNLDKKDRYYLENFLDVTKSNLFFAKGIIIVEGWTEQMLIPAIAKLIGYDLTKHEVSIVNVGSTAYFKFAKIFSRRDTKSMNIKVSILTDLDIWPENATIKTIDENDKQTKKKQFNNELTILNDKNIQLFVSEIATLEYCLALSPIFEPFFKDSVKSVHSRTEGYNNDAEFMVTLLNHLHPTDNTLSKSKFEKLKVTSILAQKIEPCNNVIDLSQLNNDNYIKYIVSAIKHACSIS